MAVAPASLPPFIRDAIASASAATGADFSAMVETARRESSFRTDARAPTSSAAGLFQFIESTWLDMVRRHGAAHGLGGYADTIQRRNGRPFVADAAMRREILDLRYDPVISAQMAGELTRENASALSIKLGREPTSGEVYAAHVLGAGGAAQLIQAAAKGLPNASSVLPEAAAANPWLFTDRGAPRSAAEVLAKLEGRFESTPSAGASHATPRRLDQINPDAIAAALIEAFYQSALRTVFGDDQIGGDENRRSGLGEYARAALRASNIP